MATRRDRGDTKARLLGEARDLYLEVGLPRFSLREVARRAGVSAAAVYRHFDDKEALLRDVCATGFQIFSSYLVRALAARTPKERLAATSEQYLRFAVEHPRDYRFIFMGAAEDFATLAPADSFESASTFHFLVDRVRECMDTRVMHRGDPIGVAAFIWAHVHGVVSLRLSGHFANYGKGEEFARFYRTSVAQLMAGLAP
ncbi:MAG TPA: TetR/AcrR family transcriptional regulator [Polyangia bacterium]|jgi:AcrR family transcriptional regulator